MSAISPDSPVPEDKSDRIIIRTSEQNWFPRLAEAAQNRTPCCVIDDAHVGLTEDLLSQSLLKVGRETGRSVKEWRAVAACAGIGTVGLALILAAILDPEPTSKLGLLVGSGILFVAGGGGSAVYLLLEQKPKVFKLDVKTGVCEFHLDW